MQSNYPLTSVDKSHSLFLALSALIGLLFPALATESPRLTHHLVGPEVALKPASTPSSKSPSSTPSLRWTLGEGFNTSWQVNLDTRVPHADFIEQGGLRCWKVVEYYIDDDFYSALMAQFNSVSYQK